MNRPRPKPVLHAGRAARKASDLFVRCLEAEGVTHIFGVPGEENADLMMSLMDSDIEFVLCRHEQAAAFIADAYGRLTGKAGVCLATLGPGVTVIERPEDVAKEVEAMLTARRPIILAGKGAIRKRAATQLRRLSHKTGIPVVNTFMQDFAM